MAPHSLRAAARVGVLAATVTLALWHLPFAASAQSAPSGTDGGRTDADADWRDLDASGDAADADALSVDDGAVPDVSESSAADATAVEPDASSDTSDSLPVEGVTEAPTISTGIAGRVVDAANNEAIIDGPVSVVGTALRAVTDVDGNFTLPLPPGTYTLRSYYDLYRPARLEHVVVSAGAVTRVEIRLQSARVAAATPDQVTVITGRADRSTAATQLELRRQSASVQDAVSAQEIARSPDTNAGDSIRRVVGASLVNGQYAFVRGLGGRYINILLNGVPLPPTDPDVPGVQLDLFPASLLSSLTLIKTFTPEMPGDFAGGSLQIFTREFPTRFTASLNLGIGADSVSHTGSVLVHRTGSLDWLGFDDGSRAMPGTVPPVRVTSRSGELSSDEVTRIGRSFPNTWLVGRGAPAPNITFGASVGNTVRVGGRPLGYSLNLSYNNNTVRTLETLRAVRTSGSAQDPILEVREETQQESLTNNVLWGALATANLQTTRNSEIGLVAMFNQSASDSARLRSGLNESAGADILARQIRYIQRSLAFMQLVGDHRELLGHARFRWQLFGSYGLRSEPDTRQLTQLAPSGADGYRIVTGTGNVSRLYGSLAQVEGGGNADLEVPIGPVTARIGGMLRLADRSFDLRRFTYENNGLSAQEQMRTPEEFFAADNIGQNLEIREFTQAYDGYRAIQQLFAPFVRADVALGSRVRIVGGARVESFRQWVRSRSPFAMAANGAMPSLTDRTDVNVLPAASMIIAVTPAMNIRAAYGATVARPLIRELAPFRFDDFVRNRSVQGNPELLGSSIHNFDLRWEYFIGPTEVLAVSGFYKQFLNPIEPVFLNRDGSITFENALSATNFGVELEARVSLARFTPALSAVNVGANLALVASEVQLRPEQLAINTNARRPLAGQSPFLGNLSLGFAPAGTHLSAYVYLNVFGPRIEDVGRFGLPDVYQQTLTQLDATIAWQPVTNVTVRLVGRNLLYQGARLTQGDFDVQTVQPATSVSLSAAFNY